MTTNRPLSAVMSVLNGQETLRASIESLLAQSYEDFRLVVVDDGSTDATPEILHDFERRDDRVTALYPGRTLGRAEARNLAVRELSSDYVAILDADDRAAPDRFELQIDFLKSHPNVHVLGGGAMLMGESGSVLFRPSAIEHDEIRRQIFRTNPLIHSTVVFDRQAFWNAGGYSKKYRYSQDYDLWLRMIRRCTFANLSDPLVEYSVDRNPSWRRTWTGIRARVLNIREVRDVVPAAMGSALKVRSMWSANGRYL